MNSKQATEDLATVQNSFLTGLALLKRGEHDKFMNLRELFVELCAAYLHDGEYGKFVAVNDMLTMFTIAYLVPGALDHMTKDVAKK